MNRFAPLRIQRGTGSPINTIGFSRADVRSVLTVARPLVDNPGK